ncbi:MAG: transketolase [Calditrichaeota bacterium]|nr:MAG: transketolase [Calditrichota bacterium]
MAVKAAEPLSSESIEQLRGVSNAIRILAMDAVQKANSGHPGMPMGMADVASVLWCRYLKHNPRNPRWADRDRFVLSAGHGSMLLYSLLYLTGYDVSLEDLKQFRQWGSKTPGHPEYGHTPGVEVTTGPLGQGISAAVGMALAERILAQTYNQPDLTLFDHFTYVIASDGDLMEGISHEACALAGHWALGKLIVLYDDNHITIDGSTDLAFSEDVLKRFEAYGWHTQHVDGHDMAAVDQALQLARAERERPSIIACRTIIGFGSPNRAGTSKAHGEPLGEEEVKLARKQLGLEDYPPFYVPEEVLAFTRQAVERGKLWEAAWEARWQQYQQRYPEAARELATRLEGKLPEGWDAPLPPFPVDKPLATRAASGATLEALVPRIPALIGGSADLTGSNNTKTSSQKPITAQDATGGYIHFGVREHGMGAILNGLALHGGFIPYGGTFLVFSDYMRASVRLAAMMGLRLVYVFTHDSIGLGEDGPTHQPIEQLMSLRLMPNLWVIRPSDATETAEAWKAALQHTEGPTALALTRQKLPVLDRQALGLAPADRLHRGAYVLVEASNPKAVILATGSEVHIALEAFRLLAKEGIAARVVSMPCWELFELQSEDYRQTVLPPALKIRVAIEAGVPLGWQKYVGESGRIIGVNRFGASAPYQEIYRHLGLTAQAVADTVKELVATHF